MRSTDTDIDARLVRIVRLSERSASASITAGAISVRTAVDLDFVNIIASAACARTAVVELADASTIVCDACVRTVVELDYVNIIASTACARTVVGLADASTAVSAARVRTVGGAASANTVVSATTAETTKRQISAQRDQNMVSEMMRR